LLDGYLARLPDRLSDEARYVEANASCRRVSSLQRFNSLTLQRTHG